MNQDKSVISSYSIILLLANYFIGFMFLYPWLLELAARALHLSNAQYMSATLIIYLWMIFVALLAGWPILKESWQQRTRTMKIVENTIIAFVALYFVSGIVNSLITLISGSVESVNQQQVVMAFNQNPILMTFTTLVYAPFVEEMTFRGAIFYPLRSRIGFLWAALVSGLSFGLVHVLESLLLGNFADLIYIASYGALGLIFCYAYEKNHCIHASMLLHFLNNLVGIIAILISSLM